MLAMTMMHQDVGGREPVAEWKEVSDPTQVTDKKIREGDDVLSRLHHLRRTLQECHWRVERVDQHLHSAQTPPYSTQDVLVSLKNKLTAETHPNANSEPQNLPDEHAEIICLPRYINTSEELNTDISISDDDPERDVLVNASTRNVTQHSSAVFRSTPATLVSGDDKDQQQMTEEREEEEIEERSYDVDEGKQQIPLITPGETETRKMKKEVKEAEEHVDQTEWVVMAENIDNPLEYTLNIDLSSSNIPENGLNKPKTHTSPRKGLNRQDSIDLPDPVMTEDLEVFYDIPEVDLRDLPVISCLSEHMTNGDTTDYEKPYENISETRFKDEDFPKCVKGAYLDKKALAEMSCAEIGDKSINSLKRKDVKNDMTRNLNITSQVSEASLPLTLHQLLRDVLHSSDVMQLRLEQVRNQFDLLLRSNNSDKVFRNSPSVLQISRSSKSSQIYSNSGISVASAPAYTPDGPVPSDVLSERITPTKVFGRTDYVIGSHDNRWSDASDSRSDVRYKQRFTGFNLEGPDISGPCRTLRSKPDLSVTKDSVADCVLLSSEPAGSSSQALKQCVKDNTLKILTDVTNSEERTPTAEDDTVSVNRKTKVEDENCTDIIHTDCNIKKVNSITTGKNRTKQDGGGSLDDKENDDAKSVEESSDGSGLGKPGLSDSRLKNADSVSNDNYVSWRQDLRQSFTSLIIIFLVLFGLMFLASCLLLVVPVVTVSIKTKGSPVF